MSRQEKGSLFARTPLALRAALPIVAVLIVSVVGVTVLVRGIYRSSLDDAMQKHADSSISQLAWAIQSDLVIEDASVLKEVAGELVDSDPRIASIEIRNEGDRILARQSGRAQPHSNRLVRERRVSVAGETFGRVRIVWLTDHLAAEANAISLRVALLVFVALSGAGLLTVTLLHWITIRPVDLIERRLRDTGPEGRIPGLELRAAPELRRLNEAVDRLAQASDERRELEARLGQAQKMEAVGRLAGGVAHNFNNALTVVLGYAEALREMFPRDSEGYRASETILQAGRHASSLTKQLLTLGGSTKLRVASVDATILISGMRGLLEPLVGERIELQIACEPGSGRIEVDVGLFESVIVNLVANARDAMPDGGIIILGCRRADAAEAARIGAELALRIDVRDTGVGMTREVQEQLFDPFFTTKDELHGSGLGLSTAYSAIEQSDGVIEVESTMGKGSCFTILLPRYEPLQVVDPSPEQPSSTAADRASGRILLVEDEPQVQRMLQIVLERAGYSVDTANDGVVAEELFSRHPERYIALVSDIGLPGMSGTELASAVRSIEPRVPILLTTGHVAAEMRDEVLRLQNAELLRKPFLPRAVTEALEKLLVDAGVEI